MAQCAVWDFRANEDTFTLETIKQFMKDYTKKYAFQLEKGDSGYIHWQGRFSLIKKRNKNVLLSIFPANYLEPTSKANHKDEFFYAMKKDTRQAGPYTDQDSIQFIPRQIQGFQPLPWQKVILDSANIFDPRTVNIIYDQTGNIGKSSLSLMAITQYGAVDVPPLNDYKEIVQLVCNICQDTNNRSPKLMIFDIPRAVKQDNLNGMFSAIEQIKKGVLYDSRHHFKQWLIDSPQIWVFTNTLPNFNYLSKDRWKVHQVVDQKLHPYYPITEAQEEINQ